MSEDCNRTKAQQLFDEAWMLKLAPGLKLVLMSMVAATDEDGVYRKGLHYLVLDTEYCAAQIGRIIKALIVEKLVNIVEPKSGRRAATYSFKLSGYAHKLSIQHGYAKVLSTQNVELTDGDENDLSTQNVDTTHSHTNLSGQNVGLNGDGEIPLNNPPIKTKDLNTRTDGSNVGREPVDNIIAFMKSKQPDIEPDRADLKRLTAKYGELPFREALEAAYEVPDMLNPIGFAINRLSPKAGAKPPPSVPAVSPNGNGKKPIDPFKQQQLDQLAANARRNAEKKASGQS